MCVCNCSYDRRLDLIDIHMHVYIYISIEINLLSIKLAAQESEVISEEDDLLDAEGHELVEAESAFPSDGEPESLDGEALASEEMVLDGEALASEEMVLDGEALASQDMGMDGEALASKETGMDGEALASQEMEALQVLDDEAPFEPPVKDIKWYNAEKMSKMYRNLERLDELRQRMEITRALIESKKILS